MSGIKIYKPSMPSSKPGKEIDVPDGQVVISCAVEFDPKGFVTVIDFKTCPAW